MSNNFRNIILSLGSIVSRPLYVCFLAFYVLTSNAAFAQNSRVITLNFRFDDATLLPDFKKNAETLNLIDSLLTSLDTTAKVSVNVTGWASPEGVYTYNLKLATRRAVVTQDYLETRYNALAGKIEVIDGGEDWDSLAEAIKDDTTLDEALRDRVYSILTSDISVNSKKKLMERLPEYKAIRLAHYPALRRSEIRFEIEMPIIDEDTELVDPFDNTLIGSIEEEETEEDLIIEDEDSTEEGVAAEEEVIVETEFECHCVDTCRCADITFFERKEKFFVVTKKPIIPQLLSQPVDSSIFKCHCGDSCRCAEITFFKRQNEFFHVEPVQKVVDTVAVAPVDSIVVAPVDTVATQTIEAVEPITKTVLALKTNFIMPALNIGTEIPVGDHWSVGADWHFAWLQMPSKNIFWQTYGGDAYARYWFGKANNDARLTGHHIGIYGQAYTFDFELGGDGIMADKFNFGGGIEYGYSLPLAKHLNMDFTLGIGYFSGEQKHYTPMDGHYVWQSTVINRWFGPTKAEVSLVWKIDHTKKGGKR